MNKNTTPIVIEKDGRKYKEVPVKSALPLWTAAAVWLIAAVLFPMYSLLHLFLVAGASAGAALIVKKILPKETRLVEIPVSTGNHDLDETVKTINAALADLRSAADRIASAKPDTASRLESIIKTVGKIRDAVIATPEDVKQIRRFLNYYLPATKKLADKYALLVAQDADSANIKETSLSIEKALAQVDTSFASQLDALFADDALDVSTDITVLETLLARDDLK